MRFYLLLLPLILLGCQDTQLETRQGEGNSQDSQPAQPVGPTSPGSPTPVGGEGVGVTQPPIDDNTTKGSGGQKGLVYTQRFGQSGEYLVYAPQTNAPTPGNAHGVLVALHGSSASSYEEFMRTSGRNAMNPVASKHNLIAVSVKAPNGQSWNQGDQVSNARYLNSFMTDTLFKQYNIDKNKIFFTGQSSGGGFLATHFVPSYGNEYSGGAFFQCGTGQPSGQVNFQPTEAMKQNFRVHMEITTGDFLWASSFRSAVPAYQNLGIQVSSDRSKSGGHCGFDQAAVVDQYLTSWGY